jgi:hypothetical protein
MQLAATETEMSDPGDPYAEGADAYLAGVDEMDNPYPVDSDDHLSWNDGYSSMAEAQANGDE